jgi:amidase
MALQGAVPELLLMDGSALTRALQAGQVSCVELMNACLDHIARLNPAFNAIVALQERDILLSQARDCDDERRRGQVRGPLHGVPFAVKDLEPVRGIRTTYGSPLFNEFVPQSDSLMVGRLRRAGALFIGKTNVPEFGLGSHTYNGVYGPTRNAWDPGRSAGGSSGGAAVALALRMVPFADGSDYGGSLRNPAGWNHVFGLRPSIGRVPSDARDDWLPSIGVLGPMARTVTDLALLLSVQAGFDARAPLSIAGNGAAFRTSLGADLAGKRIAWGGDLGGHTPCERGVLDICGRALKTFEALGCVVEPARPDYDLEAVWRAVLALRGWQQGAIMLPFYRDPVQRAQLKPEAIFEVETGLKLSAYDITAASAVRSEWYQALRRFFDRYDYFVLPSAQVFPFPVDWQWPREIEGNSMSTYHEWMKAALLVSMSGCPSLAAPAGFTPQGLPVGVQIIAPSRHELDCLQLAYAYEAASSWIAATRPPVLSEGALIAP